MGNQWFIDWIGIPFNPQWDHCWQLRGLELLGRRAVLVGIFFLEVGGRSSETRKM